MADPNDDGVDGARCFLPTPPLLKTKELAKRYGCDIAIPNDAGIGNVLMYTRTVDDLAHSFGRRISVLTAPLKPPYGTVGPLDDFAVWENNPNIERIVNADTIDPAIVADVNRERDNLTHFGHMLENIAYHYGIRPRLRRPSIYLNAEECTWAFETLSAFERPIVCLHPHSTSGPPPGRPWHAENWRRVIDRIGSIASMFEIRRHGIEQATTGLPSFATTLRQMFALVWASDVVVCFDSVVSHVATAFERPAIVLWDPTSKVAIEERWQSGFALAALSRWSYPQNDNIILLGDRDDEIVDIVARNVRERLWSFDA
jgi:hypothetical protein